MVRYASSCSLASRSFGDRPPFEKRVTVTLSSAASDGCSCPSYFAIWAPEGRPSLCLGVLTIEQTPDADSCSHLILNGEYESVGAAGDMADAAADDRIAHWQAASLLRFITAYIENAHAHVVAAFAGHTRYSAERPVGGASGHLAALP
jgi:hypothetical protein